MRPLLSANIHTRPQSWSFWTDPGVSLIKSITNGLVMNVYQRIREALSAGKSAAIRINGAVVHGDIIGGSIIVNDRVIVNGKDVMDLKGIGPVTIQIDGSVSDLQVSAGNVVIGGDAFTVNTVSGDVIVKGAVERSVKTVSGDVTVHGSIHDHAETVSGDITAAHGIGVKP